MNWVLENFEIMKFKHERYTSKQLNSSVLVADVRELNSNVEHHWHIFPRNSIIYSTTSCNIKKRVNDVN